MRLRPSATHSLLILVLSIGLQASPPHTSPVRGSDDSRLKPYLDALDDAGQDPIDFVIAALERHDLILFDDALHTAVEPFEFYGQLVRDPRFRKMAKHIFLEAVSINQQPALDAYFEAEGDDPALLYPAFQNDFSGLGWRYETYFALLRTIRQVNESLAPAERLRVLAVNAPVHWSELDSPEDVELFRLSLAGNDYTMYRVILSYLDRFRSGRKGVFLTNTRHAYKGIRNGEGRYYWNCGTFFTQQHSGRAYSIRFHNISLRLERGNARDPLQPKTTQGLENFTTEWVRMEDGLWDSTFREHGDGAVALDLQNTPFGRAAYIGNHMLDAAPGQTMYDAYDALIFLAPVETCRRTAMVSFLYTEEFKRELQRRIRLLYTEEQIAQTLEQKGLQSIEEFVDRKFAHEQETLQPLARSIGPIDAWKGRLE